MGKLGQVSEIAEFVVFLLSDRSGVVTGSVIDWDQNVLGATTTELQPSGWANQIRSKFVLLTGQNVRWIRYPRARLDASQIPG